MSLTKRWKPRPYQIKSVQEGITKKFLALFADPGLGKTSMLLQIFNKLKIRKQVKAMLVVAPLNPCYMTWPEEITGWTNFRRFKYVILHGPMKEINFKTQADIYIINPEGLSWLMSKLKGKRIQNWPFDMLVVDESGKFKSPGSARTKLLLKWSPRFTRRYIANGTPVANGFMGLMTQFKIVDNGECLGAKIGYYRDKYFRKVGNPQWGQYELAEGSEKAIMRKISKYAICLRAEDYVDMPERIDNKIYINLPAKAQKVYDALEKELFALLDDNTELVAETAASLANKLHQICNGCVYEDQDPLGKPLPSSKRKIIHLHSEKLDAIENILDELDGKPILIGYKFKHDRAALQQRFKNHIRFFDDAKTGKDKVKLQADWNAGKINILAGNPQSVGHGLNLQKGSACHVVMYSISHDYELFDQFIRRLLRSGNTAARVFIHFILAKGLYDHKVILPTLINRQETQDRFLLSLVKYRNSKKSAK